MVLLLKKNKPTVRGDSFLYCAYCHLYKTFVLMFTGFKSPGLSAGAVKQVLCTVESSKVPELPPQR